MYYKTADAFGLTFDQVRRLFPQTSFREGAELDMPRVQSYASAPTPQYNPATHGVRESPPVDGLQQWEVYPLPDEDVVSNRQALRANLVAQIDEAVAAIYGRFTRFAIEYEVRESQAQAYKDAGYAGAVPQAVAEFSGPAGMPAKAATDLILSQAASLRAAQAALSALRMRKYEVTRATTDAQAKAVGQEILSAIATVGAQVN